MIDFKIYSFFARVFWPNYALKSLPRPNLKAKKLFQSHELELKETRYTRASQ